MNMPPGADDRHAQGRQAADRVRLLQEARPEERVVSLVHAAAAYGTDYPPVPPAPLTPQQAFEEQKRETGRAYRALKDVAEWLSANGGQDPSSERGLKLQYFTMHIGQYGTISGLVSDIVAYINKQEMSGEQGFDEIHRSLTLWLANIHATYRNLIGRQDFYFVQKYQEAMDAIAKNPWLSACIAVIVMAGSGGAAVAHNAVKGWCLVSWLLQTRWLGWLAKLLGTKEGACTAVGWMFSSVSGAFLGLLLFGAAVALYKLTRSCGREIKEVERQKFRQIDQMVGTVRDQIDKHGLGEVSTHVRRMAVKYDELNDFAVGIDHPTCPVCWESIAEDGMQPVRFRNCQGRHFHCFGCWERCQNMRPDPDMCTVCNV